MIKVPTTKLISPSVGIRAVFITALIVLLSPLSRGVWADEGARFKDISASAGAEVMHNPPKFDERLDHIMTMIAAGASGGGVGDFNNDGWLDIFVNNPHIGKPNSLLRNNGDMTFTDVAEQAGVAHLNKNNEVSSMGLFFDYDGDNWQDLLVVRFGKSLLFRNKGDGTFEDVSEKAGITEHANALAAIAFDYNGDGYIDIYLGSYFRDLNMFNLSESDKEILHDSWEVSRNAGNNIFYHNNGDGTFTNKTEELGLVDTGWTMAVAHADVDNDGLQDVYVANDFGTDALFKNTGKGAFENITEESLGIDTKKGMNAEAADFDNDGDLDIYVTNVTEDFLTECNMLWQNDGNGKFVDVSQELGVCDTGWGWAGKFFDYNNDGLLDLYVANGFFTGDKPKDYLEVLLPAIWESGENPSDPQTWPAINGMGMASSEPNVLFTNTGGKFKRETASGLEIEKDSRAVLVADFNNDGQLDLFVTNNDDKTSLFQNQNANENHWLEIELEGEAPNTDAIGARIYATVGDLKMMREVNAGNGFAGGSMLRQHFGLKERSSVDEITVQWPNGDKQTYKDVKADQIIRISQTSKDIEVAWKHSPQTQSPRKGS